MSANRIDTEISSNCDRKQRSCRAHVVAFAYSTRSIRRWPMLARRVRRRRPRIRRWRAGRAVAPPDTEREEQDSMLDAKLELGDKKFSTCARGVRRMHRVLFVLLLRTFSPYRKRSACPFQTSMSFSAAETPSCIARLHTQPASSRPRDVADVRRSVHLPSPSQSAKAERSR
ncbi:hypothetical protein B0H14DRAFT_1036071 [Mycena olivaceomarginata]|nr:hypothetical protein B0H14DRAFT_1036071 [Mycena olivaceomarginata]